MMKQKMYQKYILYLNN